MLKKNPLRSNSDLSGAIKDGTEGMAQNMRCHRVGKIIAFNVANLTCDVELLELRVGVKKTEAITILVDCPLMIAGVADRNLTFGDIVGSECLVHFNDTDIDKWFETGEKYEPNTPRRHSLSDGFVELRPRSLPNKINYDNDAVVLCNGVTMVRMTADMALITNGTSIIRINPNNSIELVTPTASINLSGTTGKTTMVGDFSVTGSIDVTGDVTAGTVSLKSHVHSGVSTGTSNTGQPVG